MRTGLTKQEKTTDIWFDEKDPLIYIRTHNTDLKNRLTAYAAAHPSECRQTDADPDTGCMEFEIEQLQFIQTVQKSLLWQGIFDLTHELASQFKRSQFLSPISFQ